MSSNLPPIPKSGATAQVKYVRNFDMFSPNDLMSDNLSNNFLYSKIEVGEHAARFFTESLLGADFDRRLREKFLNGFESLLAADATDAAAISKAQQECHVVLGIYATLAAQIEERKSYKDELKNRATLDDNDDMDTGE